MSRSHTGSAKRNTERGAGAPKEPTDALERFAELRARAGERALAVFLDYDGTLCPIVEDPAAALLSDGMREAIDALARRATVAVVSGRDREDVERRVGIPGICYAGSHGFDIRCPSRALIHPEALRATPVLDAVEGALRGALAGVEGVLFERKRFSLAVHYRRVPEGRVPEVTQAVLGQVRAQGALRLQTGKRVYDLVPDVAWDKGRAVLWLLEALELGAAEVAPLYLGDDDTDVHAFRALAGRGISVGVGEAPAAREADFWLEGPDAVERLLRRLASSSATRA